jgi:Zn-dependent metalloprotease
VDLSEKKVTRNFKTKHNGVTHLTIQQQINGIDVFGGIINMNVDRTGRVLDIAGEPMPNIHASVNTATPKLSVKEAEARAAASARVQSVNKAPAGRLVYFPMEPGKINLAWEVTVKDAKTPTHTLPRLSADSKIIRSLTAWPWIISLILNANYNNNAWMCNLVGVR